MVIGGHTPGSAQLEATAKCSGAPDAALHTWNAPVAASSAVVKKFAGHVLSTRPANGSRLSDRASLTVSAASAMAPALAHSCSGVVDVDARATAAMSSAIPSMVGGAWVGSGPGMTDDGAVERSMPRAMRARPRWHPRTYR